jgi:hypothetical protein
MGVRQLGAAVLMVGTVLVATAAPAAADCDYAYVTVTWSTGATTTVPPGPSATCLIPTPWPYLTTQGGGDQEGWVPKPLPNGVTVGFGVTEPL